MRLLDGLRRLGSGRRRNGARQLADDPQLAWLSKRLRLLSVRTLDGRPHWNYFGHRFRDYEIALMNLKLLGYQLARTLAAQLPRSMANAPLAAPQTSRMCVQRDIESEWLAYWTREMCLPRSYHRKSWELCYIAQAVFNAGKLRPGTRGLAFGCGREPLPALFAKNGASILATDQPPEAAAASGWAANLQHAADVETIRRRDICPDDAKLARIDLRYVDMNAIPADLDGGFDFCWSACALEHLGSIEKGLVFIENSIKTLKRGGVAVHTLEFGLGDDEETVDNYPTVLYRKRHLLDIAARLRRHGYRVGELDFDRGDGLLDQFIDVAPWHSDDVALSSQDAQLKCSFDGFICTSFGIVVSVPEA